MRELKKALAKSISDKDAAEEKRLLALFGEGTQESFERTMADYLEATDGATSKLSNHDIERAKDLMAHNNFSGDTRSDKGTTPQSEKPKKRKRK